MVFKAILTSLSTIFLLVIPGILFQKKQIITEHQGDGINSIIVNLLWPCLVIDAMQMDYSNQMIIDSIFIAIFCLCVFLLIVFISFLAAKWLNMSQMRRYLMCFMLLFGNTGFIGIPVTKALYGETAVFYATIIELVNDVLIFTLGMILIQKSVGAKTKIEWKRMLSPGMVGVLIGLGLFLARITLPVVVGRTIQMLADTTTPLTMFMIGFQIGGLSWKDICSDIQIYMVSILKLIIIPFILFGVLSLTNMEWSLLTKTLILSFAMPVGSVSAVFSKQYESDSEFATKAVLISTALCLITIPILVYFLEILK